MDFIYLIKKIAKYRVLNIYKKEIQVSLDFFIPPFH